MFLLHSSQGVRETLQVHRDWSHRHHLNGRKGGMWGLSQWGWRKTCMLKQERINISFFRSWLQIPFSEGFGDHLRRTLVWAVKASSLLLLTLVSINSGSSIKSWSLGTFPLQDQILVWINNFCLSFGLNNLKYVCFLPFFFQNLHTRHYIWQFYISFCNCLTNRVPPPRFDKC